MLEVSRRSLLLKGQNPDGGWGYFPGKQSWLEPTAWAAVAMHGDAAAEKAYGLVRGWQNADGSCRPSGAVSTTHWTAALLVILAALRKDRPVMERGVKYLMGTIGSDSGPFMRLLHYASLSRNDRDPSFEGWPWKPGAAAWIEPTAHSITALRLARALMPDPRLDERIVSAQNMIWHQRCQGGGWNYGAREARGVQLQAFSETTALALIGLMGRRGLRESIESAQVLRTHDQAALSKAWFSVSLRMHDVEVKETAMENPADNLVTAIAEIGSEKGTWPLLRGSSV